ncbi:hypothetical protein FB45DRAFT_1036006 [Roridomyces roridus]|uniref:Uncharacterized protein n=1 Tax=Roridomyces roridus TaxID=1738132 RepID=A0AAD7B9B9_9AGAR|nr:hypothetical protein FB45DRAFT_1036006 [Roridomyces roridus]
MSAIVVIPTPPTSLLLRTIPAIQTTICGVLVFLPSNVEDFSRPPPPHGGTTHLVPGVGSPGYTTMYQPTCCRQITFSQSTNPSFPSSTASTHATDPPLPSQPASRFSYGSQVLPPPAQIYRDVIQAPPANEHYMPPAIPDTWESLPAGRSGASVLEQRDQSRLANLPQHNSIRPHSRGGTVSGRGRATARGRGGGPSGTSVRGGRGGGRGGRGGSIPGGNVFASEPSSVSQPGRTKTKKAPDTPSHHTYSVGLLPFCQGDGEDEQSPSPDYRFRTLQDMEKLVAALKPYNLWFDLDIPTSDATAGEDPSVFTIVDNAINDQLTWAQTPIAPPTQRQEPDTKYNNRAWGILEFKNKRTDVNRPLTFAQLYEYQFTEKRLRNVCKGVDHPEDGRKSLMFIAPLYQNLRGPLQHRYPMLQKHRCFPWHVWSKFDPTQVDDLDCFDDCTSSLGRRRERSLSLEEVGSLDTPNTRRRVDSPIIAPDMLSDIDLPDVQLVSRRQTLHQITSYLGVMKSVAERGEIAPWERADGDELMDWRDTVLDQIDTEGCVAVSVSGPSLEAIARTLFSAIRHHKDPDFAFAREPGVICAQIPTEAGFFHTLRRYFLINSDDLANSGTGDGPERAHFLAALQLRVKDPRDVKAQSRWADSGRFYRPTFDPRQSFIEGTERCYQYYIDGRYAILTMLQLATGAIPICPIIIYMTLHHDSQCLDADNLSLAFIARLDPATATILKPWWDIRPEQVFKVSGDAENPKADESHRGLALAVHLLEVDIKIFSKPRTAVQQKGLHRRLVALYFTGCANPWDDAEFRSLSDGVRMPLKHPMKLTDFLGTSLKIRHILLGLYDRMVCGAKDVIERTHFTWASSSDRSQLAQVFANLFIWRFRRWLSGCGFPRELRSSLVVNSDGSSRLQEGIVSDESYRKHKKSPSIRGTTFVNSITDCPLLPPCSSDSLIICLSFDRSGPTEQSPTVAWHTCSSTVEICINLWLSNLLLEPCSLDDVTTVTAFDVWMSKITSLKGGDYNRL